MSTDRYQELVAARRVRALSAVEKDELLTIQGERLKARGEAKLRAARDRTAKREAARRMAVGKAMLKAGLRSDEAEHVAAVVRYGEAAIEAGVDTENDEALREVFTRAAGWLKGG